VAMVCQLPPFPTDSRTRRLPPFHRYAGSAAHCKSTGPYVPGVKLVRAGEFVAMDPPRPPGVFTEQGCFDSINTSFNKDSGPIFFSYFRGAITYRVGVEGSGPPRTKLLFSLIHSRVH